MSGLPTTVCHAATPSSCPARSGCRSSTSAAATARLLNGLPVTARTQLTDGDVIRIGRTELIVVLPDRRARCPAGARVITHHELGPRGRHRHRSPVIARPPGHLRTLATRVFAGPETDPVFRTYQELPRRVPIGVWRGVRVVSVASYLLLIVALLVWPTTGLTVFFGLVVPLLPVLFWVAPGIWRNVCPLSSANQSARVFGFTLGRTAPRWVRERGYLLAMALFFGIAGARLARLQRRRHGDRRAARRRDRASAFVGGVLFKGKSGWCSSICPLLPLQRRLRADAVRAVAQQPLPALPGLHAELLRLPAAGGPAGRPARRRRADGASRGGCSRARCRASCSGSSRSSTSRRCRPRRCTGGWCCSCSAASAGSSSWRRCSGSRPGWSPRCGERSPSTSSTGSARTPSATRCRRCSGWATSTGCGGRSSACWPPLTMIWLIRTYWSERRYLAETGADQVTDLGHAGACRPPPARRGRAGQRRSRSSSATARSPPMPARACSRSPRAAGWRSRRAAGWGSAAPTRWRSSSGAEHSRSPRTRSGARCADSGSRRTPGWPAARGSRTARSRSASRPSAALPMRVTDPSTTTARSPAWSCSAPASPASPPPTSSAAAIRTARSTWWGRSRTCSTTGWASRASSTAGPR